jgi:hypothetical protein
MTGSSTRLRNAAETRPEWPRCSRLENLLFSCFDPDIAGLDFLDSTCFVLETARDVRGLSNANLDRPETLLVCVGGSDAASDLFRLWRADLGRSSFRLRLALGDIDAAMGERFSPDTSGSFGMSSSSSRPTILDVSAREEV